MRSTKTYPTAGCPICSPFPSSHGISYESATETRAPAVLDDSDAWYQKSLLESNPALYINEIMEKLEPSEMFRYRWPRSLNSCDQGTLPGRRFRGRHRKGIRRFGRVRRQRRSGTSTRTIYFHRRKPRRLKNCPVQEWLDPSQIATS